MFSPQKSDESERCARANCGHELCQHGMNACCVEGCVCTHFVHPTMQKECLGSVPSDGDAAKKRKTTLESR
jgi:hypothetical protein